MLDAAEPIDGWDFAELLETNIGNAAHDLYGKLYVHVGSLLLSFKDRLSTTGVNFLIHNMNATELHKNLAPNTFARIEVRFQATSRYLEAILSLTLDIEHL